METICSVISNCFLFIYKFATTEYTVQIIDSLNVGSDGHT